METKIDKLKKYLDYNINKVEGLKHYIEGENNHDMNKICNGLDNIDYHKLITDLCRMLEIQSIIEEEEEGGENMTDEKIISYMTKVENLVRNEVAIMVKKQEIDRQQFATMINNSTATWQIYMKALCNLIADKFGIDKKEIISMLQVEYNKVEDELRKAQEEARKQQEEQLRKQEEEKNKQPGP